MALISGGILPNDKNGAHRLKKEATLLGLLFANLSGIIGSGWLFGPFFAARTAGPASVVAWIVGGFIALLLAFTYAELSAAFPRGGSAVTFPKLSHGGLAATVIGWAVLLSFITLAPIEVLGTVSYAQPYIPLHMISPVTGQLTFGTGFPIAIGLMLLILLINFISIRWVLAVNNVITWWKLIIPALTIIILMLVTFHSDNFSSHGFMPYGAGGVLKAISVSGIAFSYLGFRQSIALAGESKNPKITMPVAIIGAVLISTLIYVGVQFAFIGAVPSTALAHGWAGLTYKNDTGPIAGLLSLNGGHLLGALALLATIFLPFLYIDAIISPFGTAIIYTTSSARIVYAFGEEDLSSKFFSRLTQKGVPWVGLLITFILGVLFLFPFPSWQKMVGAISSVLALAYATGPISFLALRKSLPTQHFPRPFHLPIGSLIAVAAFITANFMVYWSGAAVNDFIFSVLGVFFVIYIAFIFIKEKNLKHLDWKHAYWIAPYFIGMWFLTYIGSSDIVGGKNWLAAPWDMIIIALFSLFILFLANKAALPEPHEAKALLKNRQS